MQVGSRSHTLSLELESLKAEVAAAEEAVQVAEKALKDATEDENDIQMKVGDIRSRYEDAKKELEIFESRRADCSAELVKLKHHKEDLGKAAEKAMLEAKKLSVTISRIQKERIEAEQKVVSMKKKYAWIESEMSAFGVPGGDYDFDKFNPDEMAKELKLIKADQESLVSNW